MEIIADFLSPVKVSPVGPVSRVADIVPAAERGAPDAAILDVNLAGERSYPAAAVLRSSGVAVIFVTGYGRLFGCPPELADVPRVEKPFTENQIRTALGHALERATGSS